MIQIEVGNRSNGGGDLSLCPIIFRLNLQQYCAGFLFVALTAVLQLTAFAHPTSA